MDPFDVWIPFLLILGKCYSNVELWGGSDDSLTETGQLEAETLGKDWANTHIDHLLSSPLQRAHDTAKALSSHNEGHSEIIVNPLLEERKFGDYYYIKQMSLFRLLIFVPPFLATSHAMRPLFSVTLTF